MAKKNFRPKQSAWQFVQWAGDNEAEVLAAIKEVIKDPIEAYKGLKGNSLLLLMYGAHRDPHVIKIDPVGAWLGIDPDGNSNDPLVVLADDRGSPSGFESQN